MVDAVSLKLIFCWFESSNGQRIFKINIIIFFICLLYNKHMYGVNGNMIVLGTIAVGSSPTTVNILNFYF